MRNPGENEKFLLVDREEDEETVYDSKEAVLAEVNELTDNGDDEDRLDTLSVFRAGDLQEMAIKSKGLDLVEDGD